MPSYVTITEANEYFADRLHSGLWDTSTVENKNKALTQATAAIDRLRYAGQRHTVWAVLEEGTSDEDVIRDAVSAQPLEFPRGQDEEVPSDIKAATCEEAFALLDGKDPDQELEDLGVISQGYSSVRVTVDRSFAQEHLNAGIVSPRAWRYIKPYLIEARDFKINRV